MAATFLIIALVIFAAGTAAGIVLLVSWGIRQEERHFTLTRQASDPVTRGTRRVTGLYVRQRTDDAPYRASREDLFVS